MSNPTEEKKPEFTEAETAERRDAALRRALKTPPKPHKRDANEKPDASEQDQAG